MSITKRASAAAIAISILFLTGCTSKEQALKNKQATLEKFAGSVAHDLLDRDPLTVRESTMRLMREELTEDTATNLQNQKLMPETSISILKIIDQANKNHTSNVVQVESATAMGPLDTAIVPMKVTGKVISKVKGQPDATKPFSMIVTCKLTDDMSGYALATSVTFPDGKVASTEKKPEAGSKKRKHR